MTAQIRQFNLIALSRRLAKMSMTVQRYLVNDYNTYMTLQVKYTTAFTSRLTKKIAEVHILTYTNSVVKHSA